ncbi:MAG: asparagine synthase (glutamine-hydrolyzing) [Anaerolineae bacterium]|nr:asparagine synthase (glutamine-hydrolyzing) [Anaerolineae bacterium]
MCGIVGLYLSRDCPSAELLQRSNAVLIHRGPDGAGFFVDSHVGLAMRRLAIIDLKTGDQPIFNEDRTVAVVYNGELYNYRALRAELEQQGHRFATQSDTEVLVHGYEAWGDALPTRLNGMFAFALWDAKRQRLLLARDHLGIKPLYYAPLGDGVAFASELKALLPIEGWSRSIDPVALDWFLATRYIPSPRTIFAGARKLPPGHRLIIGSDEPLRIERYWSLNFAPANADLTEQQWIEAIRSTLAEAVQRQMIADVPLGAFLSGGIDSSIIVGLMSRVSPERVRTFTVTFPGWGDLDESQYARAVAERFNTVHTEITVESNLVEDWQALAEHLDEPFADPATLPTWLMARSTRQHVTVVLTGEGADELFQGYGWYAWSRPLPLPTIVSQPLRRVARHLFAGRRGRRRIQALLAPDFRTFYAESILSSVSQAEERKQWYQPAWQERLGDLAPLRDLSPALSLEHLPLASAIQALDLAIWLEGDPLTKADRATMLASLEARVPFLDREVVELVARIPSHWHRAGGKSKALLRRAFADLLPPLVLQRAKHAFEVPIGAWLRGALRPRLKNMLTSDSPMWQILRPEVIREMAELHWQGKRNFARELWAILHLGAWWEKYG